MNLFLNDLSIKKGKILMFIISICFFITLFSGVVYASEVNEDMDIEEDAIVVEAREYMVEDADGYKYFDLEKAEKAGASKESIEAGKVANDISKNYKNGEITEEDIEFEIKPYVSFGRLGRYGNYCGKGNNGWDKYPIDELDAACQKHDHCYVWGGNNKSCNSTFCSTLSTIIKYGSGAAKLAYARGAKLVFC